MISLDELRDAAWMKPPSSPPLLPLNSRTMRYSNAVLVRAKAVLLKFAPVAVFVGIILFFLTSFYPSTRIFSCPISAAAAPVNPIPNRVHFVHIMPDGPDSDIKFKFKHFVAIYSASFYFGPDLIYIHTDASYASIERAQSGPIDKAPSKWAHKILNLPAVVVRRVNAPDVATGTGVAISLLEHKSDFVRAQAVYEHGGIYLDWDAHALRDVKPLREAGFANVVGRQKGGQVNSGVWMSRPRTLLMKLWVEQQHEVYSGAWTTHSNDLLTTLSEKNGDSSLLTMIAERLMPENKEVLILERVAFAPMGWQLSEASRLFMPHLDDDIGQMERDAKKPDWEIDYSTSYILHAFKPDKSEHIENFDRDNGISVKYVLARQSNFALAVYPAVKHAIDDGVISADD
ncbi:hypothetical protein VE00_03621 [Pseudogymnoascus sp. WSF 3629]|nr:hypothetical protein VE00_03621 [Pseudogymnoascus sp. WSF 3629]